MLTPLTSEVGTVFDLSHEARRFRTVLKSFERNLELLFKGTNIAATVDHAALATAFANWRQKFDETKHLAGINRHDFVIFSAGLMLKELIAAKPLHAAQRELKGTEVTNALPDHELARWPEGYAYTSFCLAVAAAILREMGEDEPSTHSAADDPKFWESFRENAAESPATAVAFFDIVCGREPNWDAPDVPWLRRALQPTMPQVSDQTQIPRTPGVKEPLAHTEAKPDGHLPRPSQLPHRG
jgi:hypothetical protein